MAFSTAATTRFRGSQGFGARGSAVVPEAADNGETKTRPQTNKRCAMLAAMLGRVALLSTATPDRAPVHSGSAAKAALNDCPHERNEKGAHLAAFVSCIPLFDGPVIGPRLPARLDPFRVALATPTF